MFNWLKTSMLMASIVALFALIGSLLGGQSGMLIALTFALVMNLGAYWFSDKLVLRMYNAREVNASTAPELYTMVEDLARYANLPMPKVYIIEEDSPNAFATGRNPENAAVAATTGLLRLLTAHVMHRDILISTISATMAGAISALANFALFFGGRDGEGRAVNPVVGILIMILAPLAASLIQMAISRAREFEADRAGAEMSQDPEALASALQKIDHYAQGMAFPAAERHPETAQMMIMNPLSGRGIAGLFSTHPSTQERVMRLRQMVS